MSDKEKAALMAQISQLQSRAAELAPDPEQMKLYLAMHSTLADALEWAAKEVGSVGDGSLGEALADAVSLIRTDATSIVLARREIEETKKALDDCAELVHRHTKAIKQVHCLVEAEWQSIEAVPLQVAAYIEKVQAYQRNTIKRYDTILRSLAKLTEAGDYGKIEGKVEKLIKG